VTYILAADLREKTMKPWAQGLVLGEEWSDAYLDLIIAQVTTRIELDLHDDFEPAIGDADETLDVDGSGTYTIYLPRRTRDLTTVKTRDSLGTLTTQAATTYRLAPSLNAAGTAMIDGSTVDILEALSLSTTCWPEGIATVQLVGKFGWTAVPDDIKWLTAKLVYDKVKPKADATIAQRTTVDAIITYGPDPEIEDIKRRYTRVPVMVG